MKISIIKPFSCSLRIFFHLNFVILKNIVYKFEVILPENKFFNTKFFYLIILIFFSFFINFYYSNLGVFPIDTFLHYDSSYKILKKELPIRDYWIVSGIFVDYMQSIFFKLFGVSWTTYILHSSLFNSFLTVFVFNFFLHYKNQVLQSISLFNKFFNFSLSFFWHSFVIILPLFSLIATFLIIKGCNQKKLFLVLAIFLLFLSFSKQVPAAYLAVFYSILFLIYLFKTKNFKLLILFFFQYFYFLFYLVLFL